MLITEDRAQHVWIAKSLAVFTPNPMPATIDPIPAPPLYKPQVMNFTVTTSVDNVETLKKILALLKELAE